MNKKYYINTINEITKDLNQEIHYLFESCSINVDVLATAKLSLTKNGQTFLLHDSDYEVSDLMDIHQDIDEAIKLNALTNNDYFTLELLVEE